MAKQQDLVPIPESMLVTDEIPYKLYERAREITDRVGEINQQLDRTRKYTSRRPITKPKHAGRFWAVERCLKKWPKRYTEYLDLKTLGDKIYLLKEEIRKIYQSLETILPLGKKTNYHQQLLKLFLRSLYFGDNTTTTKTTLQQLQNDLSTILIETSMIQPSHYLNNKKTDNSKELDKANNDDIPSNIHDLINTESCKITVSYNCSWKSPEGERENLQVSAIMPSEYQHNLSNYLQEIQLAIWRASMLNRLGPWFADEQFISKKIGKELKHTEEFILRHPVLAKAWLRECEGQHQSAEIRIGNN